MSISDLSRRRFLGSSASLALLAGLNVRLDADEAAPAPVAPGLRWGVIGSGARGALAHIPGIKSVPGMEILAVCDVMPDHLRRGLAAAGPQAQGYADYQQVLARSDLDAVVIATPGFLHREMLLAALDAGKHVLCEKPMGLKIEEGQAMRQAAQKSNRVVAYGTQLRYSRFYQEVRRQIAAGKIGRPTHLGFRLYRQDWNPRVWMYRDPKTGRAINWRYSQAASGGIMCEEGCHYFDILNWMANGLPQSVQSAANLACYQQEGRDTWDHSVTTLSYGDGAIGSLEMCLYAPSQLELRVMGSEGALLGDPEAQVLTFATKGRGPRERLATPAEVGHQFAHVKGATAVRGVETAVTLMYQDFAASVRESRHPWADSDKAFSACKTAWLADEAARSGRPLAWNALG